MSLVLYLFLLITSTPTVISFIIPQPSSPPSSLLCDQTIQRHHRTGPALKSNYPPRRSNPTTTTRPQQPSSTSTRTNNSSCLHASKSRSTDKSPSPTDTGTGTGTDTDTDTDNTAKKTLYEILSVPSDATRSELKRAYVALARRTHPDAVLQNNNNNNNSNNNNARGGGEDDGTLESFDTIARAYRT